ncbi:MAG: hypothetical protein RQ833_11495 [Sphingomonadaceae bacterium]|nr:hypothetical protein [Sphingomonadaceae bacterium]
MIGAPVHPDWDARLTAMIAARTLRPFEWGRQDCVTLAAAAALAMSGTRPPLLQGLSWRSGAGAGRALRQLGCADLLAAADAAFGARHGPLSAGAGWIVAAPATELPCPADDDPGGAFGHALGVMWRGHALFAGADGLVAQPPRNLVASWQPWGHRLARSGEAACRS